MPRVPRNGGRAIVPGKAQSRPNLGVPFLLRSARIVKAGRHHPDDMKEVVVQAQILAQNPRVGAEDPFPQTVADDHFQVEPWRLIVGIEPAAQFRLDSQQGKIAWPYAFVGNPHRLGCTRQIRRSASNRRHKLEDSGAFQIFPLRHRHGDVPGAYARLIHFDPHQFIRLRIRQRMQQRGIHHPEDRRRRSNAQSHRHNRNRREARRLHQHAQRVARVLQQILHQRQPPFRVILFPHCLHRAKLQHRLAARLGRPHAGAQILLGLEREVFGDFILQALVGTPPCGEIRQAYEEASQEFHVKSSALILKKHAMMAAVCSHWRVSASSCLRPAAVSR